MIYEYNIRVLPEIAYEEGRIKQFVSQDRGLDINKINALRVFRRSIDARQRQVYINLSVRVFVDEKPDDTFNFIKYPDVSNAKCAIVVGAGPAGLFAALRLIELGVKPILLERGKDVAARKLDLARISRDGVVDSESNYCFGEGGAGAYSDGKLFTRSKKRGSNERILQILVQHGASPSILIDAHPHIGSDKLPAVIANIRKQIIASGGEVHFSAHVSKILRQSNTVIGVALDNGIEYKGPVILATGHSARDVYYMLNDENIQLQPKGIAVGVRLEHPQHLIDCIQYHSKDGRGKYLPAAEYNFVTQVHGCGVYSFCMCPGGVIVPASSSPNELVVNGMSSSHRASRWSNSGMVVEVRPESLPQYEQYGVFSVLKFQQDIEQECYRQANATQVAPAQSMVDFILGKETKKLSETSYAPGIQSSRIDKWLPQDIVFRLQEGFRIFNERARGFISPDATVIAVESRTSSPVRIPRDKEQLCHISVSGLYPVGEGAGYAGGIVSAAVDGERAAEALSIQYR